MGGSERERVKRIDVLDEKRYAKMTKLVKHGPLNLIRGSLMNIDK